MNAVSVPVAGTSSPPEPTLTILVATLGERRESFGQLLDVLLPQTEPYVGRVRVLAYWSNGEPALPEIRQRMLDAAAGDYVVIIDDDDLVPDYYLAETMAALGQWPDYVGWLAQCYINGRPTVVAEHSLRHDHWHNAGQRLARDICITNPVRTVLAKRASFRITPAGQPEDRAWVGQLRGLLQTEVFVDKVMYHYLYSSSKSAGVGSRWRRPTLIHDGYDRLPVRHPHFAYIDPDAL